MAQEREFRGRIGRDWRDSEPWWPPETTPPAGAPNVVLIVLDDVGFAQLGCYGSPIDTPVIDGLAASGVRLANFHTTALCSPSRACLLTGRNHHRSGMGRVADLAVGYPGYWGKPPRENGYLSEILRQAGYATYAVGKWHLSPENETDMASSRATWPLARGFDRWYGFHGGETHQFVPALFHDNHSVRPPRRIEEGYHLSADLADRSIEFVGDLRAVDAERPVLPLPVHRGVPLSASGPAGVDRPLQGSLRLGVGRVARPGLRPPAGARASSRPVPVSRRGHRGSRRGRTSAPWSATLAARFMECFAGFLSYTDEQLGRVFSFLRETWRPRQHRGRAGLGQRRQLRRRVAGVYQRHTTGEPRSGVADRDARADRRDRRPDDAQQLPVGLDHGREHAVQALEARGARGRGGRSVHRELAGPVLGRVRRHPPSVRPCGRRPADRARAGGGHAHRRDIEGVAQSHLDGISFAPLLGPEGAGMPARTRPSTSRCSDRAPSITTGGRP